MVERAAYPYVPLSGPNYIRLLYLIYTPGAGLHCTLKEVDLDDAPIFEALSYTWEKQVLSNTPASIATEFSVICDDFEFPISENLHDALMELRKIRRDCPIWIDQICINQSDIIERSSQVNLMGRIFGSARCVIAWMGTGTIKDEQLHLATDFSAALECHREAHKEATEDEHALGALEDVISRRRPAMSEVLSLGVFFTSWFSRVWIIQECLLAQEIILLYGSRQFTWQFIANTLDVWVEGNRHMFWSGAIRSGSHNLTPMSAMCAAKKSLLAGNIMSFETYLSISRTHACSDPRDRVYGLLSIPRQQRSQNTANPLEADYSRSIQQAYTAAMRYLLLDKPSVGPLCLVEDAARRKTIGLPSWVPDFQADLRPPPFERKHIRTQAYPFSVGDKYLVVCGETLRLKISLLSTVVSTGETLSEIEEQDQFVRLLRLALRGYELQGKRTALMSELPRAMTADTVDFATPRNLDGYKTWLVRRILKVVLHMDQDPDARRLSIVKSSAQLTSPDLDMKDYTSEGIAALVDELKIACADWDFDDRIARLRAAVKDEKTRFDGQELARECGWFQTEILRVMDYRRAFLSKDGHIGIGPVSLRCGDTIVSVADSDRCYILRQQSGAIFNFVGECYIPYYRDNDMTLDSEDVRTVDIV